MPYFHVYEYDDFGDEESERFLDEKDFDYDYESAQGKFSVDSLKNPARLVYDALSAMGITMVRCHYDGGGDEGFADFREAIRDGEVIGVEELCKRLEDGPVADVPDEPWIYPETYLQGLSRFDRAKVTLDNFAFVLASSLLGEGYGTGEYTMYGNLRADFATGEIIDERE